MKSKLRYIVICAVLAIVLSIVSILVQSNLTISIPKITVYNATQTINVGSKITKGDLVAQQINLSEYNDNYVTNESKVNGLVACATIYQGEHINSKRLISSSSPNYFVGTADTRRFSIPTAYIDDPYSLTFRAGDVVDILFTPSSTGTTTAVQTQVLVQHATVVGAVDSKGNVITTGNDGSLVTAMLFESTDANIQLITSDQYKGKFKFTRYPLNYKQ